MLPSLSQKIIGANNFEALFKHASIGILVTDNKGKIMAINPFALKEFGYAEKELIGKKVETLIPVRFKKKHVTHREKYSERPQSRPMGVGMELYALKKDGTEFPVEVSLGNYYNNDEIYVIAFINNIIIRKKAEAQIEKLNNELEATVEQRTRDLKDTLQELEISRDKLKDALTFQKALVNNAGAIIIATDEKGIIKLFNHEASHSIGYKENKVIDKMSMIVFHDPNEIDAKRIELNDEFGININDSFGVLVEKASRNIHNEEQYTYVRSDGTSFPVSLTISAIKSNDGLITGYMCIAIDISERKKAEEELLNSLEKEKELGELKSRFVSMASHEFRTPLSTVLSSAYLIEQYKSTEDHAKREKHIHRIISSVNMLTDILNDFLSVGKIEEGKIQVRMAYFNIKETITEINAEIKNNLKKHQEIQYIHKGDPIVFLDPSLLKHIILNLVSNASKFSPESTPIEIKTIADHSSVLLAVKDYGMGIAREDQKHLMERFFRGTNASNIQGTGLGLHIISKYAELMNGTVVVKSELQKGSEFIVTFNKKIDQYEKNIVD